MKRIIIPIGTRFGRLTVLDGTLTIGDGSRKQGASLCVCDCGIQRIIRSKDLRRGSTQSCGCLQQDNVNLRGKDWARKRRVRPAMITTAMRVWSGANTNYNDGCSFEKFLELSQLDCFYCGARPANKANPYARPSQKNHGYLQEWIDQS